MKKLQKRLIEYNEIFDEYKKQNNKEQKSYEIIEGKVPILISAPHSVRQIRNGKLKGKDLYTGPIVIEIAKQTGCNAIYKAFNNQDDANYDIENNDYKEEILKIIQKQNIKLLLDIHGAQDTEMFDIDIGTGDGFNLNGKEKILDEFVDIFHNNGVMKIGIDKKFKANTLHTISNYIATKTKIPCMQIEITKKYRNIEDIKNMNKVIKSIIELIEKMNVLGY